MNLKTFLRGGGAATLAVAIALTAFPSAASARPGHDEARERPERQQQAPRPENRGSYQRAERVQAPQQRAQAAPQQQWRGQAAQQQRQEQWRAQAAQQQRAQQSWNRGDNRGATRSATAQERSGRNWNRGDRSWSQTRQAPVQQTQQSRTWSQRSADANRTYRDNDRNRTYRDGDRNTTYRDGQRTQTYRNGGYSYRDGNRSGSWRGRDGRTWNRDWRNNNNYNWYSYRNQYRDRYRLGRYYAPYSNYRYNRLSIGFFLDNVFFGSRYWINDPGYYRLPPAYGGLRWVRYYDDALLVDTYSGEVVDVIYDFFW
jgi:hypothetical protein